jgi:hypothetical protein
MTFIGKFLKKNMYLIIFWRSKEKCLTNSKNTRHFNGEQNRDENQNLMIVKWICEFVFKKFDAFLGECEIQWQASAPYSPQQNNATKQANRMIMECSKNMILA